MDELDANDVSLLKAVKLLRWITEQHVNKSAVEELKKEKKIHEIFHENEKFKKNIEKFKQQLKSQRINLRWKLATEESVIKSHEQNMALTKVLTDQRIKEEIFLSVQRAVKTYGSFLCGGSSCNRGYGRSNGFY